MDNPELHICIVFGKNEGQVHKSLSSADFDFFRQFKNITVVYAKDLHGKYYGNETMGVITSVNLHDYSFKNNIEFGVFSTWSILDSVTTSSDKDAWNTCMDIAHTNKAVFVNRPVYKKKLLIGKEYVRTDNLLDNTSNLGKNYNNTHKEKFWKDFPSEIIEGRSSTESRPSRVEFEATQTKMGYCIRTGVPIPYNVKMPFTAEAYAVWRSWGDVDYAEKYCHKTGKPSNGRTSMRKPIL